MKFKLNIYHNNGSEEVMDADDFNLQDKTLLVYQTYAEEKAGIETLEQRRLVAVRTNIVGFDIDYGQ